MESVGESDVGDDPPSSVQELYTESLHRIISGAGAISPFLKYPWKVNGSEWNG